MIITSEYGKRKHGYLWPAYLDQIRCFNVIKHSLAGTRFETSSFDVYQRTGFMVITPESWETGNMANCGQPSSPFEDPARTY